MDYRGQTAADGSQLPRGIRNNNPGNIETGEAWQGAVGVDAPFIIFADDTWGLRALATDLTTKIKKDGLDTITKIITVYAPPSENDTASYIAAVASDSGIGADEQLGTDAATISSLMRGIVNHENGEGPGNEYVTDQDIATGIGMMGQTFSQVFQAGIIAVQANPVQSLILLAVGVVILNEIYKYAKKS